MMSVDNIEQGNSGRLQRKVNEPNRFGKRVADDFLSSESDHDPYEDSLEGDTEFLLTQTNFRKENVGVGKNGAKSKRKKVQNSSGAKTFDYELYDIALDDDFDALDPTKNSESNQENQHSVAAAAAADITDDEHAVVHQIEKDNNYDEGKFSEEIKVDGKILSSLYKTSIEVLARVTVLEQSLLKNKMVNVKGAHEQHKQSSKLEQFHLFMKSNGLPMTTHAQVNQFEEKLKDNTFQKATVRVFYVNFSNLI